MLTKEIHRGMKNKTELKKCVWVREIKQNGNGINENEEVKEKIEEKNETKNDNSKLG